MARQNIFFLVAAVLLVISLLSTARTPASEQKVQTVTAKFAEVEILLSDEFSLADISALPTAPGSDLEVLDNGERIRVQLPASTIQTLLDEDAKITVLRNFVLVESTQDDYAGDIGATAIPPCQGPHFYGENSADFDIPDYPGYGDAIGICSPIPISDAPVEAKTTCIELGFMVCHEWFQDLILGLTYLDGSKFLVFYDREEAFGGCLEGTVSIPDAFDGHPVNQIWLLCATDVDHIATGFIESWWIKVYYEDEVPPPSGCSVEDFETGDFIKFPWEHSGDATWVVTSWGKHSGNYSAQAGSIDHDGSTTLQVTLDCIEGDITFHRKVSSESGYDYLRFYIDEDEKGRWSGEKDWSEVSFPVTAGTRTFKWTYSKDSSDSEGDDTAWIDDIVFPVVCAYIFMDDFEDGVIDPFWDIMTDDDFPDSQVRERNGVLTINVPANLTDYCDRGLKTAKSYSCQKFEVSVDFRVPQGKSMAWLTTAVHPDNGTDSGYWCVYYFDQGFRADYYTWHRNKEDYGWTCCMSGFGDEHFAWHTFKLTYDAETMTATAYVDDILLNSKTVDLTNFRISISTKAPANMPASTVEFDNFFFAGPSGPLMIGLDAVHWAGISDDLGRGSSFAKMRDELGAAGHNLKFLYDFTPATLSACDAIFIQQAMETTEAFTAWEITDIHNYVAAGGGLLAIADGGYYTDETVSNFNGLLAPYGVRVSSSPSMGSGHRVTGFVSHPVTDGITTVEVNYQRRLVSISAPAIDLTLGTGQDDMLAAVDGSSGAGNVVIISDSAPFAYPGDDTNIERYDNRKLLTNIADYLTLGQ